MDEQEGDDEKTEDEREVHTDKLVLFGKRFAVDGTAYRMWSCTVAVRYVR